MNSGSRIFRRILLPTTTVAMACMASWAVAADKAKVKKVADAPAINQPPADAGHDDDAKDNAKAKAAAKKKAPVKNTAKAAAAQKKNDRKEKALQARRDAEAQAEAEAVQEMQQMQQLQQAMQQGGAGMRQRRGNNGISNQSMFLLMRQYDANGNGQLDPQELQAMKLALAQTQAGGQGVAMAQTMQRFDADGDGQLSPQEQQAMQAALTRGGQGGQAGGGVLTLPNGKVIPKSR